MDIKKNLKYNYKLGTNYVLFPTSDGWILTRSGSYRPIMNSGDNTEEQLEQFVKEHREYNTLAVISRYGLIANLIILILCVVNMFVHNSLITYFNFGALMVLIPMLLIVSHIGSNNHEVYQKVLDEDIEYYGGALASIDKANSSTRAKRGRKKSSEVQK